MREHSIHIDREGIYLFSDPVTVTMQVDHELLIIFSVPIQKSCGLLFLEQVDDTRNVVTLLESLHSKLEKMGVSPPQIYLKFFGLSAIQKRLLEEIHTWVRAKGLIVASEDLGRNVARHLRIECGTGRVGLTYSVGNAAEVFLSSGTARQRKKVTKAIISVWVITHNTVKQTLIRQAVEEYSFCQCSVITEIDTLLSERDFSHVSAHILIILEDIANHPWFSSFLECSASLDVSTVKICWVGSKAPPKEGWIWLGNLEPEFIGGFKRELSKVLSGPPLQRRAKK